MIQFHPSLSLPEEGKRRIKEAQKHFFLNDCPMDSAGYTRASARARKTNLSMLDCFCGMGGVSDGFALEGFDVSGIDIIDAPRVLGYKHWFIQANMVTLKGEDFKGYDVIWGSPPCRDFTILNDKHGTKTAWKTPKDPEKGMTIVNAFLCFIDKAEPHFWIMENVYGLEKYLPNPSMRVSIGHKKHVFYGNFPSFPMPRIRKFKIRESCGWDKLAHWKRSKIPLACSRAFARACKEQFLEVSA